jgi:mannose/cellobiose epimerase-like protein (N-acyl-D-glucosamine 2-epimerase family)
MMITSYCAMPYPAFQEGPFLLRARREVNRTWTFALTDDRPAASFGARPVPDPALAQVPIRFDAARAWLFDRALPLWSDAGLDRERGGSVEALNFRGADAGLPFKRTRVQARQVYAFTHAHLLGWRGPSLEAAEHCWRFLKTHGRRTDGAWVRLIGREGGALDPTADAYDIAFVLFALAWRLRCGESGALREAHAAMDALDRILGLGPGQGWRAAEDDPRRLLNPHMHLLEATATLAEIGGDDRFATAARDILVLVRDRMFEPEPGVLGEAYDEHWRPAQGVHRRVWPGHHYEWVWLLHRARDVTGLDLSEQARALYRFAERRGRDPEFGLVDDGLDGPELKPSGAFRIWQQAEALKAHLAMFEHEGADAQVRIAEVLEHLLDRYLAVEPAGGWQDRFGPGWTPLAPNIPASILYHLMLAFSELLRLEPALKAATLEPAVCHGPTG